MECLKDRRWLVLALSLGSCDGREEASTGPMRSQVGHAERSDAGADEGQSAPGPRDAGVSGDPPQDASDRTCAEVETTPIRSVPSVTFLVDGSASMRCVYPEASECSCEEQVRKACTPQGESRWHALSGALFADGNQAGLVDTLQGAVRFGLWIYNNSPVDGLCPGFPTQVDPALNQRDDLAAAFPQEPPGYNTPTGLALDALVSALPDADIAAQQGLGPQRIVLATDGQPFACVDPVTLEQPALDYAGVLNATQAARTKGIDVYVMSLAPADGEFAAHLRDVAQGGGTGEAYMPADRDELSAALDAIIGDAISCTVALKGKIESPWRCTGRAILGEQELRCGDPDGFVIDDAGHVTLQGAACARFKREPGVALSMKFPCDSFEVQ